MSTKEAANPTPEIVQFDVTGQKPIGVVAETGDQISLELHEKIALRYLGQKWANSDSEDEKFLVLNFEDATGRPLQMNAGAKLRDSFEDIETGRVVVLQYVKDIDTGKKDPMKDYRVEVY